MWAGLPPSGKGFTATPHSTPQGAIASLAPSRKGHPACEQRGPEPSNAEQNTGLLCPLATASPLHYPQSRRLTLGFSKTLSQLRRVCGTQGLSHGVPVSGRPSPLPPPRPAHCEPEIEASCRKTASPMKSAAPRKEGAGLALPPLPSMSLSSQGEKSRKMVSSDSARVTKTTSPGQEAGRRPLSTLPFPAAPTLPWGPPQEAEGPAGTPIPRLLAGVAGCSLHLRDATFTVAPILSRVRGGGIIEEAVMGDGMESSPLRKKLSHGCLLLLLRSCPAPARIWGPLP